MKQISQEYQKNIWNGSSIGLRADKSSKHIIKMSKKYIKGKILDIGAGNGALMKEISLQVSTNDIHGVDLAPRNSSIIEASATKLPFENYSFDTIFSTDLIEHLNDNDLDKMLNETNRVLKIGGYGIFNTPYNENLDSKTVICPYCKETFHVVGHCQSFNTQRIKKIFKEKGFELVKYKILNYTILNNNPILGKLFYFFKLEKFLKYKVLTADFFFVVKKIRD